MLHGSLPFLLPTYSAVLFVKRSTEQRTWRKVEARCGDDRDRDWAQGATCTHVLLKAAHLTLPHLWIGAIILSAAIFFSEPGSYLLEWQIITAS